MAGKIDQMKGWAKDKFGKATGDKQTQAEGKIDRAKGSAKDTAQSVKSSVKGTSDSIKK